MDAPGSGEVTRHLDGNISQHEKKVMAEMALKEDKTAPLLGKMAWLDESNKQHKVWESKGKACNRAGPREGTSIAGKVTESGQGP